MRKIILGIVTGFIVVLFTFQPVQAHILKTDGTIGAVLHVSPEDDPIAGEESAFFFEFKNRDTPFKPSDCDCTVTVMRSGEEIYSQNLFRNNFNPSLTNTSFLYTFPQKDIYTVLIEGKPNSGASFSPFRLSYEVRVERDNTTAAQNDTKINTVFVVIGGVLLFFGAIFILKKLQRGGEK